MRILHCSDSFWPRAQGIGGIQIWLTHLARRQREDGHSVGVITWPTPGCAEREIWEEIEVFRWPVTDLELIKFPERMADVVRFSQLATKMFRPDIVHSHLNRLAVWVQTLGPQTVPTILTVHVPAEHDGLPLRLKENVLRHARVVVAPSQDLADSLAGRYPQLVPKLQVIPYGLLESELAPAPLKTAPFTFLCLGRLVPEKGFAVAISALAETQRSDFRLILAGEGSETTHLQERARQLGVVGQIDFRGWIHPEQIPALIDESAVVLVPSRWREVFGLVALEAAQRGRPVIASHVGGLPEVVADGVTGCLVPPDNPSALAQAMLDLERDQSRLTLWSSQASTMSRQRFNLARCADAYQATYLSKA